jgi:hypothetical protein
MGNVVGVDEVERQAIDESSFVTAQMKWLIWWTSKSLGLWRVQRRTMHHHWRKHTCMVYMGTYVWRWWQRCSFLQQGILIYETLWLYVSMNMRRRWVCIYIYLI